MSSISEILNSIGNANYVNNQNYKAVDIDKVKIDGNELTSYRAYQFLWEKSFVKSPERSSGGQMSNINSHATFIVPHLILDFSLMSIDDYRKIMKLHYGSNEHVVECYDIIYNKKIKAKMYFATEEMAKLYTISQHRLSGNNEWLDWIDLVGVKEYKVELIGTNNDLDLVTVIYNYNPPEDYTDDTPVANQTEKDVYKGEEIIIGENCTFKDNPPHGYKFKEWKDSGGQVYTDGKVYTCNNTIELFAQWQAFSEYTLSFNYGVSDIDTKSENGVVSDWMDQTVEYGKAIGTLPTLSPPTVKSNNGTECKIYQSGNWYKSPIMQDDKVVNADTKYWIARNTIIYALFEKILFTVTYNRNYETSEQTLSAKLTYGDKVPLLTLARDGYKFSGWYLEAECKNKFSGTMPPYDLTIYAKWETAQ